MEEEGAKCFVVMAADAPLASRVSRAVSVLAPEGAESDKHLFPESCLQDDWTDDYAKSEAFAAEYRAVTDPDDGQKWPKGLTEEDGKLYRNGKLLVPESRLLELCEAWHHHMLRPGVKKQALDMQRRFEIDHIVLYTAIKKVRKGCSVCQACNPDNRNVKGEAESAALGRVWCRRAQGRQNRGGRHARSRPERCCWGQNRIHGHQRRQERRQRRQDPC